MALIFLRLFASKQLATRLVKALKNSTCKNRGKTGEDEDQFPAGFVAGAFAASGLSIRLRCIPLKFDMNIYPKILILERSTFSGPYWKGNIYLFGTLIFGNAW